MPLFRGRGPVNVPLMNVFTRTHIDGRGKEMLSADRNAAAVSLVTAVQ